MLVVCSDIHVLGSPLMRAEATRMQDLASEFSKIFRAWYPRTPTAGQSNCRWRWHNYSNDWSWRCHKWFAVFDAEGKKGNIPVSGSPHPPPARPLAGRGAQAPRCWDPNLGPPQLFSCGCAPAKEHRQDAHLPVFSRSACRWINHCVCDAWPVRRRRHQTHG